MNSKVVGGDSVLKVWRSKRAATTTDNHKSGPGRSLTTNHSVCHSKHRMERITCEEIP